MYVLSSDTHMSLLSCHAASNNYGHLYFRMQSSNMQGIATTSIYQFIGLHVCVFFL
jgi:hypothetical protein